MYCDDIFYNPSLLIVPLFDHLFILHLQVAQTFHFSVVMSCTCQEKFFSIDLWILYYCLITETIKFVYKTHTAYLVRPTLLFVIFEQSYNLVHYSLSFQAVKETTSIFLECIVKLSLFVDSITIISPSTSLGWWLSSAIQVFKIYIPSLQVTKWI